jgi:hypothetical protein
MNKIYLLRILCLIGVVIIATAGRVAHENELVTAIQQSVGALVITGALFYSRFKRINDHPGGTRNIGERSRDQQLWHRLRIDVGIVVSAMLVLVLMAQKFFYPGSNYIVIALVPMIAMLIAVIDAAVAFLRLL